MNSPDRNIPYPLIPFSDDELTRSIGERFSRVVSAVPGGHLAYVDTTDHITYARLHQAASALADELDRVKADDMPKQPCVALLLDPDWRELQALIGVSLAGNFYIALDANQGYSQLSHYLQEYPILCLVTNQRLLPLAQSLANDQPGCGLINLEDLPEMEGGPREIVISPYSYHSVYFTSGSTGIPRGVIRMQASGLHSAYLAANDLGMSHGDRITLTSPITIGMSVTPSLGALLNGATIYRRMEALASPAAFYQWLKEDRITIARASAGLIRSLTSLPESTAPLPDLRLIDTGGESFTRQEIDRLFTLMPGHGMFNVRFASNEAGNYAMFRVRAGEAWEGERNPAGYPPAYTKVSVVDEERQE
ncbi:MAG: AMP-binding protein, partial [Anaerolineae bacterium]|nr:AMP-binding protein [Anaerolineae bacterium]